MSKGKERTNLEKRMKPKDNRNFQLGVLKYYFTSGFFEGLASLALLLSIPTDPKNAWLFGFSKTRLGMVAVFVIIIICFLMLTVKAFRNQTWTIHVLQKIQKLIERFRLQILSAICLVFLGVFGYALLRSTRPAELGSILQRIFPFVLFATTRAVQTVLLIVLIISKPGKQEITTTDEAWFIPIQPRKLTRLLFGIVAFLLLAGFLSSIVIQISSNPTTRSIAARFNLDQESAVPTYFSALILLLSASLLWIIATDKRRTKNEFALQWLILAVGFLYLSLDEAITIHELLVELVDEWIRTGGIFFFTWVVVAIPLVLFLAVFFSGFLFHLPANTRNLFLLAGSLYLAGAIGFELIGGWFADQQGVHQPIFYVLANIEEILEMIGVVVFIHGLLEYIWVYSPEIRIHLHREEKE